MDYQNLKKAMKKQFSYLKEQYNKSKEFLPKSISYTKLELPIHYSNLVYIEDMHIENSSYFITTNGFVSKGLKLSSPKHDAKFQIHNCIFRIYPKTYNVNKEKVIEYIDNDVKSIGEEIKELHFKFSAEMFNNLDILQNKFGEPVRYGDIIMLLHEHSRMFVEFIPATKTLRLAHHDTEATLFSVEPAKDIMLNDDQILKTGQPIKLKIAWFSYANRNLFFSLRFPYQNPNLAATFAAKGREKDSKPIEEPNKKEDEDEDDLQIIEESYEDSSVEQFNIVNYQGNTYDEKEKQYYQQPEIIVEEHSTMKWRFSLYSTFTTNENLIVSGDLVQIFHCFHSSVLSIDLGNSKRFDQQSIEYKLLNLHQQEDASPISRRSRFSRSGFDMLDSTENDNDNLLNAFDQNISEIDEEEDFASYNFFSSSTFKLIGHSMFTDYQDINSTWVLINLIPSKRHQSFIRYYDQDKLDSYHMVFRIQNFKTKQILTIQQSRNEDDLMGTKRGKHAEGFIEGEDENSGKVYKFVLVNNSVNKNEPTPDSEILTEEYQYSLFSFKKSLKASSYYSARPEKNDFLYIYHVVSKSYLRIIPTVDNKCALSLVKNPDEREIYKILPIDPKSQWEYRFLNNLMNLINHVISNLMKLKDSKNLQATRLIIIKMMTITRFVLDNLTKYLTNLFIDKFVYDVGYNSVVKSRQILISNFGFTNVFLRNLIFNYWINNNLEELRKLNELLISQQPRKHLSTGMSHNDITLSMFSYTKAIFDFLILYCRDNEEIKDELYMNLDIYFYFVNLIDSCLYGMIEIFKNNEAKLISLIRDCNQNEKFSTTLYLIASLYFPKHEKAASYTLIDLIFDFIEISKYEKDRSSAPVSSGKEQSKGISLLSREKYFKLLKALVNNHSTNILENQREIINKIISKKKDNTDAYIFKEFIYCKSNKRLVYDDTGDLPPSLKELLFSIADQNPDDKISLFIQSQEQFAMEKLFPNGRKKVEDDVLAANIKWIIYLFPSGEFSKGIIDPDEIKKKQLFAQRVKTFYYEVINQLGNMEDSIDFTNRSQVNLINSFLLLLKIIFEKNSLINVNSLSYSNISGILLSYLTRKFQVIQANDQQSLSHLIHGEMNEKKLVLKQRITKTEHSQYSSIAEGWLNAYMAFKFFLLKSLEETKPSGSTSKAFAPINFDSNSFEYGYGNVAMNSENKELLNQSNINQNHKDEDLIASYNQEKQKGAKNDMTFYTKDELIEVGSATKKLLSKTRSIIEETVLKPLRTSSPDIFRSKTKMMFNEMNSGSNVKCDICEDDKQKNMDGIFINIINILKLSVKQNIAILNENFYNYYNALFYRGSSDIFSLNDLILHCVPNLESGIPKINALIRTFTEERLESKSACFSRLTNLNSVFEERIDINLNFVQNLIKVFNFSEDINMQESILDLIYAFFHQRRKFFNSIGAFNEHLSDFSTIKYNPFNNKEKIKSHFRRFFYAYEKKKQEYAIKTIDAFLTSVLNEFLHIFKKILKYWKNEFRILSLAYANKYYQNLEENELMIIKIEKVLKLLQGQRSKIEQPMFTKAIYTEFLEEFFDIVYFIRDNAQNSLFNSLTAILNEDGGIFNKMFVSLFSDLINKGRLLSGWYCNRTFNFFRYVRDEMSAMHDYAAEEVLSFKNKYYSVVVMMVTLQKVTLPQNEKTLQMLQNLLLNQKTLLKFDSFASFFILLSITDLCRGSLTLDYFSIMEQINELNKNTCDDNVIRPGESLPNPFSQLYVDIMLNVLDFIIEEDAMINEVNLDEMIVDNFIYLIRHMSFEQSSKNALRLRFVELANYFHEIDSLNKIYLTKIRQELNDSRGQVSMGTSYLPPLSIYSMFRKYFNGIIYDGCSKPVRKNARAKDLNKKQLLYVKRCFALYKYLLFYYLEIDQKYFESCELMETKREAFEWLRLLIKTGLDGNKEKALSEVAPDEANPFKFEENMSQYFESSFFYLIHCYSVKKVEKSKKYLQGYKDRFYSEGIDLSLIAQRTFSKLKNYCNDDSLLNSNGSVNEAEEEEDEQEDEENERERQLIYSTGTNEEVCLYILKQLRLYDDRKESQLKYKQLFERIRSKSKQKKIEKLVAFKGMLWESADELYQYANNETSSIIFYLLILLDSETTMQYDEIFITFINKIVEYISIGFSKTITHKRVKLTNFLLFIISEILRFYEENEDDLIAYTIRKKTLREVQVMFLKTGIIEKCLSLVCRYNTPKIQELLPNVFEMFCKMLRKGNANSQETFLAHFTTKNTFEPVFSFMHEIITGKMNEILSNKANIIRKRKKHLSFEKKLELKHQFDTKLDSRILQFLQLLCENHNRKLQLYLHSQSNFRKCYDLVTQTQNYLTVILLNFEPFLFEALVKCFDLLIEFIQGPCLENQLTLINSKILITLNDILLCYVNCEKEVINKRFPERVKDKEKIRKELKENESQLLFESKLMRMSAQQISLLAFKSSILLLALVENRTKDDNIYQVIKAVVKGDTLKEVYCKIFFEHLMILNETNDLDDYSIKLNKFNKAQDVEEGAKAVIAFDDCSQSTTPAEEYLILETGFFLYFLHLYYEDYERNKEHISQTLLQKSALLELKEAFDGTMFDLGESLYHFLCDFTISILETFTYIVSAALFAGSFGKVRIFNLMRRAFKHRVYSEANCLKFYKKYTQSIEILRDGTVYRVYFYLLPYCTNMNKFEKIRFLEEIDRTNAKTKLMEIIKFADLKKYEFEFDYKVKEYSAFIPLFGSIFKNVELWKDLSLILNLAQNFFNIFAVYKVTQTYTLCLTPNDCVQIGFWVDEKSFFRITKEEFFSVIRSLSFCQCSLATLIFVEFISRKMPAIYKSSKETVNQKHVSQYKYQRYLRIWSHFAAGCLLNFDVLYYLGYVVFAFLGTYTGDFFFAVLLFEIIQRFKTLRNVLKAIKNPYKQLFFTFTLWIILIYYFAIFGYAFFRSNFPNDLDCSSLVRCVSTIFYENNKRDNGIGGYLSSIYTVDKGNNPFIGRFWYDELFNLLLKILIIQMISGIIIDNFALLRVQEMDMLSDMENVCTICGLKKEEIEKIYTKYGRTYSDHRAIDHRLFNYVFYMIYLSQKDKTEFTGVESYVYELAYNQKDITWFPIDSLYIAKPGEVAKEESNDD